MARKKQSYAQLACCSLAEKEKHNLFIYLSLKSFGLIKNKTFAPQ